MTAWLLFKHSISMLLRNRIAVFRIFGLPILLIVLLIAAGVAAMFGGAHSSIGDANATPNSVGLIFLAAFICAMFIMFWPVVAWHRYVLGEEPLHGFVPPFHGKRILGYFGTGLLLSLVVSISVIPVMIVVLILGAMLKENVAAVLPFIAPGLAILPTYIFNRISIALVASALGRQGFGIRDAWRATAGATDTILILSIMMIGLQTILEQIGALAGTSIGQILVALSSVVVALIQVSLLTTLYGYFVEKRPI